MILKSSSQNCLRLFTLAFALSWPMQSSWAGFSGDVNPGKQPVAQSEFSPDRVIARLKKTKTAANLNAALSANNMRVKHEFKSVPGLKVFQLNDHGNDRSKTARIQGLKRRMEALMATGLFEYVEPDWQIEIMQTPTDTAFVNGELWGLLNTGQNGGVAGIDTNVVPAWTITTGIPDVVVGVIDTGILYTHQDLSSNMWTNPGEIPGNGIDDDSNGWIDDVHGINAISYNGDPLDDNNHGTHVAGTIAASAFDAGSHVGVAYNVRLMGLKALSWAGTGGVSGAIACIEYAIDQGVDILNNSWGGTGFSQALMDAIDAANSAGILFVAAAGNSASNNDIIPFYPSGYDLPNIVSVAAIDRTGALASFSNYGHTTVDLAAPGLSIYSTTADSNSSYAYFNGTSMAAPHVAGVAALIASAYPAASVTEIHGRLLQSTFPLPDLVGYTSTTGMVDAEAALLISDDGVMEVKVSTTSGALVEDAWNSVFIHVTDLIPVTDATVTMEISGGSPIPCLDDGTAPDSTASDAIYSGSIYIPSGSPTIDLTISITAPGKDPILQPFTFSLISPPPNDNFADRYILPTDQTVAYGTNVDATLEPGEPLHPSYAGKHSVWWEWTPNVSDSLVVSTKDTTFDTTLAVYQGTELNNLTLIGEDDDGAGYQSVVRFTTVAGQTYLIQVNGYSYATGDITLQYGDLDIGVPNDNFANRIVLEPGTVQTIGSNIGSTVETVEPMPLFELPGLDTVWYEWIAPSDDPATITTAGSTFDTIMGIWQGTDLSSLVEITSNDDAIGIQSSVTFTPVAGESYMIQIYGYLFDPEGKIVLNYPDPAPPAVANDHFSQRILLPHGSTQTLGTNLGATVQIGEPNYPVTSGNASVWWEWIAPLSGFTTINTIGSSFDTTLAVYSGHLLDSLTLVEANDDSSGIASEVTFFASQGETYKIQVNGSGTAQGDIKLNYPSPAPPKPFNDDFNQRIVLEVGTNETTGSNLGATLESGEPVHPTGSGSHSVWWEWYAPSAAETTITTIGSNFDTTLAVYTGRDLSTLELVAENNDSGGEQSSVTFTPIAGRGYKIRVNGYGDVTGSIQLIYPSPDLPRPINDNFVDRIVLSPGTIQVDGYNEYATREFNEPINPPTAGGASIWWEWIAPSSGTFKIDTFGSTIDTTLAIYTGTDLETLALVGANDDAIGYFSAVTFDAIAGTSYMIQLDGWDMLEGLVFLNYPMPFPVAATPGRYRLAGSVGQTIFSDLLLTNGDSIDVDFSIDSPESWITGNPVSGTLTAGTSTPVSLQIGSLPSFTDVLYSTVTISLNHPSLSTIELPIEIIDESLVIEIPDPNLRKVVEENLGRLPGEPIAALEMSILTSLDAIGKDIVDLTGLEYAVNLFYLHLNNNQISNLIPLESIPYLFILDLSNNNISDISPIASQNHILDIDLRWNYLDINPGSDDRAIIDSFISLSANVLFDPQKDTMITYSSWTTQVGLEGDAAFQQALNGPLSIENILAYGMGLDPSTATAADMPVAYHDPDTNTYRFSYYRNLKALGVTTSILNSYDLSTWELATPVKINVLWDDGNGHQMVEAVFEDSSSKLFFTLDVSPY